MPHTPDGAPSPACRFSDPWSVAETDPYLTIGPNVDHDLSNTEIQEMFTELLSLDLVDAGVQQAMRVLETVPSRLTADVQMYDIGAEDVLSEVFNNLPHPSTMEQDLVDRLPMNWET